MDKPRLVIALEGVLTTDPLESFFALIASAINRTPEEVEEAFVTDLQPELFTGKKPEQAMWDWLANRFALDDQRFWQDLLLERRFPLLGMHVIPRLAEQSEVVLLCGQRKEWFADLVEAEDIAYAVETVAYCSTMGFSKQDAHLYQALLRSPTLFIDRDKDFLQLAKSNGMSVCYADQELQWVEATMEWLTNKSQQPSGWKGLLKR